MCIFIPIMSEMYDKTYRFRKVSCAFVMLTTFAITRTQATHRLPAIRIGRFTLLRGLMSCLYISYQKEWIIYHKSLILNNIHYICASLPEINN